MSKKQGSEKDLQKLREENQERLKELACINRTNQVFKEGKSIPDTLQQVAYILPKAWQYPEYAVARIRFDGEVYTSPNFEASRWLQKELFKTIEGKSGSIEVYYRKPFVELDEGPFLHEERSLLINLSVMLQGYLNSIIARDMMIKSRRARFQPTPPVSPSEPASSRQLLKRFLNKNNYDRDIYHDLMSFKVREILLVANLYDAYSIEKEGRFSEHVLGQYSQLNLTSIPRITGVSTAEEAMEQLHKKHFDLVILMMGADKNTPVGLSCSIKNEFPYIPVFLLLNNNTDIEIFEKKPVKKAHIDKIFIWNGDAKIFFAMIKHVEDKINVENDTSIGMVRVILLVEDSEKFYSRYLPMLYNIVMDQTRRIIEDVSTDELYKVLRLRARPKILLASTYEEAVEVVRKYKDYLLCLITDVKYPKQGVLYPEAGFDLVRQVKEWIPDLPMVIQSQELKNAQKAFQLKCTFINKNSESLLQDFKSFITHYLGFGNFIYRNNEGRQIATAKSLKEFEAQLRIIPDESLIYHARKDHFSLWLMARGEIQAAKILNPAKVTDFDTPAALREYLLQIISEFRNEQNRGKVIPWEESEILDETNILSLAEGSLGGKGRGLAFVNTLIHNLDFSQYVSNIHIRAPRTLVIGTDEFEQFLDRNQFHDLIYNGYDHAEIKKLFLNGKLSDSLLKRLRIVLKKIRKPLAIRSSGLFEDSLMQPFAGIFETYILPNTHPDLQVRLNQLQDAVRLVFASVFSIRARGYIEAIHYKLEEEKMAVVIQEVVGHAYGNYFYPHISGVAQSYNYYPFAHMKPDEGFAVAALGLGKYVVEGEKAYRFSPKYPTLEINSPKDQFRNSQLHFYAVDLNRSDLDFLKEGDAAGLIRLDIDVGEEHGTINHCASVYDAENNRIVPGLTHAGPRIINFANILRYNYIPLAKTLEVVLDVVKEALGAPVEIEFAVDLNRDKDYKASFYLLQIKPLIGSTEDYHLNMKEINQEHILLYTEKGMGNGQIEGVCDVIFVKSEDFDKSKTPEIAAEIEALNQAMQEANRSYVLIGPGRWGTRDRWIGIPVSWTQISNAKVIVETSMADYPLDASSGSHFFHNVTTMNVGYFSVQHDSGNSYIRWELLAQQEVIQEKTFVKHIRFKEPMQIKMDGRRRLSVISINNA